MENTATAQELTTSVEVKEQLDKLTTELKGDGWHAEDDHYVIFKYVPVVKNENGSLRIAEPGEESDAFVESSLRRVSADLDIEQAWSRVRSLQKGELKSRQEVSEIQTQLYDSLKKANKLVTLRKGDTYVECIKQLFTGSKQSYYQKLLKKHYKEVGVFIS